VALAEKSFSKLKLIKNDLRNSMSQNRLSNIAILNIERSRTDKLYREKIIDNFAYAKARKKNVCLKINKKNYIMMTDLYCFFIIV